MEKMITRTTKCHQCGAVLSVQLPENCAWGDDKGVLWSGLMCDSCHDTKEREGDVKWYEGRLINANLMDRETRECHAFLHWDKNKGNKEMRAWVLANYKSSLWIADDNHKCKTRCLVSIAKHLCKKITLKFYRSVDLISLMQAHSSNRMLDVERFVSEINMADLLILDDFGREKMTEPMASRIYGMIDYRYSHNKQIWVTTNKDKDDFMAKFGADMGRTIMIRLESMCVEWQNRGGA